MKRFIGNCIYCDSKDDLSDEHVVPYGLLPKGQEGLVLEKASCPECCKITSSFEREVLRNHLRESRAYLKMKTRRKYPKETILKIGKSEDNKEVAIDEVGAIIMLPIFEKPTPSAKGINVIGSILIRNGGISLKSLADKNNTNSIGFSWDFKPIAFARMIAKIAYGFAIYKYGKEKFKRIYVLDAILSKDGDLGRVVGCIDRIITGDKYINLKLGINNGLIISHVRLFEKWGGPTYVAILGRSIELTT